MASRAADVRQLLLQVDASVELARRNLGSLRTQVANDTEKMELSLGKLSSGSLGVGEAFGKTQNTANSLLGFFGLGTIGATTFGLALLSVAKDAEEHAQALRGLGAVLDATGNKTGLSKDQLVAFSEQLEGTMAIHQEEFLKAQTVLSQYDGVAGTTFKRAIVLATDMAAVFGGELSDNTEKLGGALQNLAQGHVEGLTRGFKFLGTETLDAIEKLAKMGDTAGAQEALLKALEERVGGAGEAKAQGVAAAFFRLKDAISDTTREMLNQMGILPAFIRGMNTVADLIAGQPTSNSQLASEASLNAADAQRRLDALRSSRLSGHTGFYSSSAEISRLEQSIAFWSRKADEYIAASRKDMEAQNAAQDAAKTAAQEAKRRADAEKHVEELKKIEGDPGGYIDAQRRAELLAKAQAMSGATESSNALRELFRQANVNVDPKMTAWCAAFVNAVLAAGGLPGTGSLSARSFLNYGSPTNKPEKGDIVVLSRGADQSQGHVGFFAGYDPRGRVMVTGGNTGARDDRVGTDAFPLSRVLGFRRAPDISQVLADQAKQPSLDDLRGTLIGVTDAANGLFSKPLEDIGGIKEDAAGLGAIIANMPDVTRIVPVEVQQRFEELKRDAASLAEDVLRTGFGFEHMTVSDVISRLKEMIVQLLIIEPIVNSIREAMSGWHLGSAAASGGAGGMIGGFFQSIAGLFGGGGGFQLSPGWTGGALPGVSLPHFAGGGSPPVGRASLVGERGPELFVPKVPGTIVPNGAFGGGNMTIINVDAKDAVLANTVRGWIAEGMQVASQAGAVGGASLARQQITERQRRALGYGRR